jgi:Reverse transcriptase (RNA-dependent DNA polymerase)
VLNSQVAKRISAYTSYRTSTEEKILAVHGPSIWTPGLKELGFQQSKIDKCLYYHGCTLFVVYVDNGIMMDLDPEAVEQVMKDLATRFEIKDEGTIDNYLGVTDRAWQRPWYILSQPHLIDSILEDLKFSNHGGSEANQPATFENKLHKDVTGELFTYLLQHHQEDEFLGKVHSGQSRIQCAPVCPIHVKPDEDSWWSSQTDQLISVWDLRQGILQPDLTKSFKCYVDAEYCGNWNPLTTEDPSTAKSCSGYIITYMGCLIANGVQSQPEYLALSTALRDVIPKVDLLSELRFDMQNKPTVHCKLFAGAWVKNWYT